MAAMQPGPEMLWTTSPSSVRVVLMQAFNTELASGLGRTALAEHVGAGC
jgi:hypothetical protein